MNPIKRRAPLPWGLAPLLISFAAGACTSPEDIRVRDDSQLLFSARARVLEPVGSGRVRLGAEFGGFTTRGDYATPTGFRDYHMHLGHAAAVAEFSIRDLRVMPKLGIGYGDFEVEGETRTLREDGFGGFGGIEGRYSLHERIEVVARGSWFKRSSLDSWLLEAGLAFRPIDPLAIELLYASSQSTIEEVTFFPTEDSADVRSSGLMIGATLSW